jgi:hypothetical protein
MDSLFKLMWHLSVGYLYHTLFPESLNAIEICERFNYLPVKVAKHYLIRTDVGEMSDSGSRVLLHNLFVTFISNFNRALRTDQQWEVRQRIMTDGCIHV